MVSHVNSNKSTISHCTGLQSSRREAEGEAGVRMGLGGGASQPRKQKSQLFIFGYGMESFKWIILDIPLLGPRAAKESFIFLFKSLVRSLLKYHINQHVLRPNNIFQASYNPWRIQVPEVELTSNDAQVPQGQHEFSVPMMSKGTGFKSYSVQVPCLKGYNHCI